MRFMGGGLLLLLTGCAAIGPTFEPRIDQHDVAVMSKEAAIIVNAIPIKITAVSRCTRYHIANEEWPLIKTRFRLRVENSLKGSVALGDVDFYRYEWCGDYIRNGTPEWDRIWEGQRSVFFLEPLESDIRAFSDHTSSRHRIFTGYHKTEEIRGDSAAEKLFWLMTTPGQDTDPELFAATLRLETYEAAVLVGQWRVYQKLLQLLGDESFPKYQAAACIAIGWSFPGRSSCFDQTYMSTAPAELSIDIQAGRRMAAEREAHIQNIFINDPWRWVQPRGSESCETLEILAMHEDPNVAKLARSLLESEVQNYFQNGCPFPDRLIR